LQTSLSRYQSSATLTSLAWIGATGNQTVQITFDNDRNSEFSVNCLATDPCSGAYYPKRINLVIPANTYLSNYTVRTLIQNNIDYQTCSLCLDECNEEMNRANRTIVAGRKGE